ncbi:BPTI/Kunitz inhibitor domain-containing protein [Caenorhabditis elegans]|uniref:BPTI/Kunitz inhibitor domain-containing protein n=1 Tax=Caenorhabditis elegans TaxID=6239 RepID=G5EBJ3_CAEEL|nr:BPTI/Kunitz inhibitor domain-containing protein [Caenorhabditis elegans]CAA99808.2 BPTI/Kunitz inhibitor domain-containing protein [Caenorhabditis elegans]|eukprot:NP_506123.2 Uncharacterized protein CELE_C54D10.10 [Caenorhabditis elegans]
MQFISIFLLLCCISSVSAINCRQEKDTGVNCDNKPITLKFYFDMRTNVCQPLFYRGCGGNENRFESRDACSDACVPHKPGKTKKPEKKEDDGEAETDDDEEDSEEEEVQVNKDMSLIVNACKLPTDAKIVTKAQKCDNGCPTGYRCTKKNFCCPYPDHVCSLPVSSGSERLAFKHYGRYAYQPGLKNCIRFSYFGQEGNFNNFLTYNDCKKFCMSA